MEIQLHCLKYKKKNTGHGICENFGPNTWQFRKQDLSNVVW